MTGSLRIKNGIFFAVISYKDEFGQFKQKWISSGLKERGNKRQAKQFLEEVLDKFKNPTKINENISTPEKSEIFFMDYIKNYIDGKQGIISPSTLQGYWGLYRQMYNFFGLNIKLKEVTYKHLLEFYNHLRTKRLLKNSSIKKYKEILAPALRLAYRDDLIPKNPYEFMPKLKNEKPKKNFYDIDELEKLFTITDQSKIGLIVRVAACYGFRRSEILGLRWQSIDFKHKTITIENKVLDISKKVIISDVLKTASSNRTLPLIPEIEKLLLERKEEITNNRNIYGNAYCNLYLDYVFVDDLGKLYLPDFVSHTFSKLLKQNHLKHIRFHDLRQSCASLLVNKGVPMKNIQEWLGHSSYNLTADTYSHLNYDSKLQSANVISQTLNNTFSEPSTTPLHLDKNDSIKQPHQVAQNSDDEILQIKQQIAKLQKLIEQKENEKQHEDEDEME